MVVIHSFPAATHSGVISIYSSEVVTVSVTFVVFIIVVVVVSELMPSVSAGTTNVLVNTPAEVLSFVGCATIVDVVL